MKLSNKAGFTIIETMLFLSITGLLAVGILIGTGTSINLQRYRDSVTSLQSILQQQYSEVANVSNDNNGTYLCNGSGVSVALGSAVPRGQSNCVVLGRYITTTSSTQLSIKSIVGFQTITNPVSDDVAALGQYKLAVLPIDSETYEVEWGSSFVKPSLPLPGGDMNFSILILRSPLSGVIRTFIDSSKVVAVTNFAPATPFVDQSHLGRSAKICVNSNGLFTGTRMAVLVNANATSANDIEMLGDATSGC